MSKLLKQEGIPMPGHGWNQNSVLDEWEQEKQQILDQMNHKSIQLEKMLAPKTIDDENIQM